MTVLLRLVTNELRFLLQTIFLEKTDCFLIHSSSVSHQAGLKHSTSSIYIICANKCTHKPRYELKSIAISLSKRILLQKATASILIPSCFFFPLHTDTISLKTCHKDSVTNKPRMDNGSHVMEVYHFLLLWSPNYIPSWQPALFSMQLRGPGWLCPLSHVAHLY